MKRTYLDGASAAPVSKVAWKAFEKAKKADGNPSAPHAEGRAAKDILERSLALQKQKRILSYLPPEQRRRTILPYKDTSSRFVERE
jgi:hypothetical protein